MTEVDGVLGVKEENETRGERKGKGKNNRGTEATQKPHAWCCAEKIG